MVVLISLISVVFFGFASCNSKQMSENVLRSGDTTIVEGTFVTSDGKCYQGSDTIIAPDITNTKWESATKEEAQGFFSPKWGKLLGVRQSAKGFFPPEWGQPIAFRQMSNAWKPRGFFPPEWGQPIAFRQMSESKMVTTEELSNKVNTMPVYTRKVYVLNGSILFGTEEGVEVDFENIRKRVKSWAHWCLGEDVELVEEDPECFTVVTERTIALNNCWEKI